MAPKAISLFAGAGGLDFGFEAAGFQIAVALNMDPVTAQRFKASRPGAPYPPAVAQELSPESAAE
jgi:DNA (cytosine-5)-methyltransferase 1